MKAWVLRGIQDIRLEDIKRPEIEAPEVLLKVKAAGICGSDVPRVYKNGTYTFPTIPGHEFSGVVEETGEKADMAWKGKRVGVFPLIPCRKCAPCRKQQYEMCRNYSYLGSRRDGGFAEYAAVPAANLIALPENVSFESADISEPKAVAVHSMRRIAPAVSDTVVVWGLGTIGLLLLMFLKDAGIENILAVGNKDSQRHEALGIGLHADCYCDSKTQDAGKWILEHTNGCGGDVFFECVGKNETLVQAVEYTAPGGSIMLVGNPYTDMKLEKNIYWKILRNQLTVAGTWNSSFTGEKTDDWNYVLDRVSKGRVNPERLISHRFSMEKLEKGLQIMRDKTEDYVKVMGIL